MRFKNNTKMDDALLKEIIRFCCPSGVSGFDIEFKNSSNGYKGKAYCYGSSYHRRNPKAKRAWFVVIGCSKIRAERKWTKPYKFAEGKGYLGVPVFSNEEAIVHLVAHELRHLWQRIIPKGRRVWGARGQFSERDADAYGIRNLRAWRKRNPARGCAFQQGLV